MPVQVLLPCKFLGALVTMNLSTPGRFVVPGSGFWQHLQKEVSPSREYATSYENIWDGKI